MSGKGEHSIVYEGQDRDVELGTVWDSGHLEGSKISGKVRRTPGGWSLMKGRDDVGTIGRDGAAAGKPLRIEEGRVLFGDVVVAHVDNPDHAAGALALVWLGRPDLYGEASPAPPAQAEPPTPPPPPPAEVGAGPSPLVLGASGVGLLLVAGALAAFLLSG